MFRFFSFLTLSFFLAQQFSLLGLAPKSALSKPASAFPSLFDFTRPNSPVVLPAPSPNEPERVFDAKKNRKLFWQTVQRYQRHFSFKELRYLKRVQVVALPAERDHFISNNAMPDSCSNGNPSLELNKNVNFSSLPSTLRDCIFLTEALQIAHKKHFQDQKTYSNFYFEMSSFVLTLLIISEHNPKKPLLTLLEDFYGQNSPLSPSFRRNYANDTDISFTLSSFLTYLGIERLDAYSRALQSSTPASSILLNIMGKFAVFDVDGTLPALSELTSSFPRDKKFFSDPLAGNPNSQAYTTAYRERLHGKVVILEPYTKRQIVSIIFSIITGVIFASLSIFFIAVEFGLLEHFCHLQDFSKSIVLADSLFVVLPLFLLALFWIATPRILLAPFFHIKEKLSSRHTPREPYSVRPSEGSLYGSLLMEQYNSQQLSPKKPGFLSYVKSSWNERHDINFWSNVRAYFKKSPPEPINFDKLPYAPLHFYTGIPHSVISPKRFILVCLLFALYTCFFVFLQPHTQVSIPMLIVSSLSCVSVVSLVSCYIIVQSFFNPISKKRKLLYICLSLSMILLLTGIIVLSNLNHFNIFDFHHYVLLTIQYAPLGFLAFFIILYALAIFKYVNSSTSKKRRNQLASSVVVAEVTPFQPRFNANLNPEPPPGPEARRPEARRPRDTRHGPLLSEDPEPWLNRTSLRSSFPNSDNTQFWARSFFHPHRLNLLPSPAITDDRTCQQQAQGRVLQVIQEFNLTTLFPQLDPHTIETSIQLATEGNGFLGSNSFQGGILKITLSSVFFNPALQKNLRDNFPQLDLSDQFFQTFCTFTILNEIIQSQLIASPTVFNQGDHNKYDINQRQTYEALSSVLTLLVAQSKLVHQKSLPQFIATMMQLATSASSGQQDLPDVFKDFIPCEVQYWQNMQALLQENHTLTSYDSPSFINLACHVKENSPSFGKLVESTHLCITSS